MDTDAGRVKVVFFHFLHNYRKERGQSSELETEVPAAGVTCRTLLSRLEVPADMVEAAFINGVAGGLDKTVRPGDRVAFVPPGTPGPYRVLLGMREKA
ncbi:MAG: MoaD/ThiS family protein [bacterium]